MRAVTGYKAPMATTVKHRSTSIVTLDAGETIAGQCKPGDIALVRDDAGWWTHFVGENGEIDSYDTPFDSYNKALWAAKAAAEFEDAQD
ncbi:MAG: hypothetical protein ACM3WS_04440 [Bacillota bacterium]